MADKNDLTGREKQTCLGGTWQLPGKTLQELRVGEKEKKNFITLRTRGAIEDSQELPTEGNQIRNSLMRSLLGFLLTKKRSRTWI